MRFLPIAIKINTIQSGIMIFDRRQMLNKITKSNHLQDACTTRVGRVKTQRGGLIKILGLSLDVDIKFGVKITHLGVIPCLRSEDRIS